MKILRTDMELETPFIDKRLREMGHELVLLPDGISQEALCREAAECELILMCYTPVTAAVIKAAPKLKGIVKYGVGIDAIDIPAAHERGIAVVNIPEYAEETVAEGAFTLLLALVKQVPRIQKHMARQAWVWPESQWQGMDISGKTLGIVGCGKIGACMARMAGAGFRCRVIGFDPYKSKEEMALSGIEKVEDLKEMLSHSDFVSLHAVLTGKNEHLIGEPEFAAMKPTAYFINTARGALVDEIAMLKALGEKIIAGAGLDVFSSEPLDKETHYLQSLYEMENVILFPHLTFFTTDAMQRLEKETLDRCLEIIEGRPVLIKSHDKRLKVSGHQSR